MIGLGDESLVQPEVMVMIAARINTASEGCITKKMSGRAGVMWIWNERPRGAFAQATGYGTASFAKTVQMHHFFLHIAYQLVDRDFR